MGHATTLYKLPCPIWFTAKPYRIGSACVITASEVFLTSSILGIVIAVREARFSFPSAFSFKEVSHDT
jgi:hypothetical protein